jgi:hypothetical protein
VIPATHRSPPAVIEGGRAQRQAAPVEWTGSRLFWSRDCPDAAIVAWACAPHGPRSPVGETQRIQT